MSISTLIGLPLKKVMLSQNNISSFDNLDIFLDQAKSLVKFELNDNPLKCDCAFEPLVHWYRLHDPQQDAVICDSPVELQGYRLLDYDEPLCTVTTTRVTTPAKDNTTFMVGNPNERSGSAGIGGWAIVSIVFLFVILIVTSFLIIMVLYKRRGRCPWNRDSTLSRIQSVTSGTNLMSREHQYDEPDNEPGPEPPARSTSNPPKSNHRSSDIRETPTQTERLINPQPDSTRPPSQINSEPLSRDVPQLIFDKNNNCTFLSQTADKDNELYNDPPRRQGKGFLQENISKSPYLTHSIASFARGTKDIYVPIPRNPQLVWLYHNKWLGNRTV